MSGLPLLSGAVQVTSRLSVVPETAETVGSAGAEGGSSTSAMSMVTAMVSVPPLPSSALTVTEYSACDSWS